MTDEKLLEVCAAVGGVVLLRSVLVFCSADYLEFLACRLQLSFFDEDVLLCRDQLDEQKTNTVNYSALTKLESLTRVH